jgi:hypothetical protein
MRQLRIWLTWGEPLYPGSMARKFTLSYRYDHEGD